MNALYRIGKKKKEITIESVAMIFRPFHKEMLLNSAKSLMVQIMRYISIYNYDPIYSLGQNKMEQNTPPPPPPSTEATQ